MKKIKKPESFGNILSINKDDQLLLIENFNKVIINSYYINSFQSDTKKLHKFIKHVESKFRASEQYKNYLGFIKYEFDLTNCSILGNIDDDDASIELHHYPFTLYDITEICLNYHFKNNINLNSFKLIEYLLELHYQNLIGLVPLSETVHELVHNKDSGIFIAKESIFGNVNKFVEIYKDYIPTDTLESYNKKLNNEKNDNVKILNKTNIEVIK